MTATVEPRAIRRVSLAVNNGNRYRAIYRALPRSRAKKTVNELRSVGIFTYSLFQARSTIYERSTGFSELPSTLPCRAVYWDARLEAG